MLKIYNALQIGQIAVLFICGIISAPAFAYLDPGTGSILLQGILASIMVILGIIKKYWKKITSMWKWIIRSKN